MERDAAVAVENWNDVDMNAVCPDSITETTYDGMGRILSVSHSIGDRKTTVSSQYDLLGRVTSRTDKMGRTSLYSYSQDGLTMIETTSPGATLVTRKAPSGLVVEESGTGREARYYNIRAGRVRDLEIYTPSFLIRRYDRKYSGKCRWQDIENFTF